MTVAELIHELQAMPQGKQVQVSARSFFWRDIEGETMQPLCHLDAAEADEVRNEGAYVMIWGGKL